MDSPSILDVRSGVTSIIQEFSEASELLTQWRRGRAGKKAVGQEEFDASLYDGKSTIERTLNRFSLQHRARFDRGDRECLASLINIQKGFREAVVNVLTRGILPNSLNAERIDPLVLRQMSEATRKDTVMAMDNLAQRIITGNSYATLDPGDVLPHMPLRPVGPPRPPRPPGASASSSQTSAATNPQGSGSSNSSQTSFATASSGSTYSDRGPLGAPFAPTPQRNNLIMPLSGWKPSDLGASQALVRSRPSSSAMALSWMKEMFPLKPTRAYYDIAPSKPTPAVIPTFKCDDDATDILEEGRIAAQELWDAADRVENDLLRSRAHSAPIPEGAQRSAFVVDEDEEKEKKEEEEHRSQTPLSQEREIKAPAPSGENSPMHLRPVLPGARSSSAQGGRRIRSEPMLEFSAPTPRFRRNVS